MNEEMMEIWTRAMMIPIPDTVNDPAIPEDGHYLLEIKQALGKHNAETMTFPCLVRWSIES